MKFTNKKISQKTYNRFKDSKLQEIPENEKVPYTIIKEISLFMFSKMVNLQMKMMHILFITRISTL